MLIIEGLDGCGKTTLVSGLIQEKYNLIVPQQQVNNSYQQHKEILQNSNLSSMIDRSFISEIVYGKILANKTKLTEEEFFKLLKLYGAHNSMLFYLYAPKEVLLERRKYDTKDQFVLANFYKQLLDEFELRLDQASQFFPIYRINSNENSQSDVLNRVKKLIKN